MEEEKRLYQNTRSRECKDKEDTVNGGDKRRVVDGKMLKPLTRQAVLITPSSSCTTINGLSLLWNATEKKSNSEKRQGAA
jgi:hypothetical protein